MKHNVLIIDDSATVREQVSGILVSAGFDVVEAADGKIGLSTMQSRNDVALVLCDVNMPNMNGIEFLEALRPKERTPSIPVVMLTTDGTPETMARARRAGACAWIVKPFRPDRLVAAVQKLIADAIPRPTS